MIIRKVLSVIFAVTLLALASTSCSTEADSDVHEFNIFADNKADTVSKVEIEILKSPEDINTVWEDIELGAGKMIGVALIGQRDLSFTVWAKEDGGFFNFLNDLKMTVFKGDFDEKGQPTGDQIGFSGDRWHSPSVTISQPEEGVWYFFIIKNMNLDKGHAINIESSAEGEQTYSMKHDLSPEDALCFISIAKTPAVSVTRLNNLEVGNTYTITVWADNLDLNKIELFESEQDDAIDYSDMALDLFRWPNYETSPVQLVQSAELVKDEASVSITFESEEGKMYGLGLVPNFSSSCWMNMCHADVQMCAGSSCDNNWCD
jgi:hypothetical protein